MDELNYVQITGTVEEIAFRNEANSYTVVDISCDGELITAVGELPEVSPGEKIVLTGVWTVHQSYGKQFVVKRFERYLPNTVAGYLKFLSSGALHGIGPKTARQIVERFGENTFSVIENEPERLSVIRGISEERAKKISAEFKRQYEVRTVIIELERYGFTPSECIKIHKKLGLTAIDTVMNNPYILCGLIDSFSFERAEETAAKLPQKPESRHRNRAGIEHILSHNTYSNGHTCLPYDRVVELAAKLLSIPLENAESAVMEMVEDKLLFIYNCGEKPFLSLPKIFIDEKNVAERIEMFLLYSSISLETDDEMIDEIEVENGVKYEKIQREAIKSAAENGMIILTGGPGTGKTTTVKGMISFFEKKHREILLAAPTGRAAKRMTELTGKDAKTIHRLLEVEWTDEDEPNFKRNSQNPLDADVIIIDEVSMIDISLFARLLDAIKFGCRLILVGDSDQLPAVGPGNCLEDMISSGKIPTIKLKQIFRQAESSLIVTNAHRIIDGESPILDCHTSDFFFMPRSTSTETSDLAVELELERLPKAYGYNAVENIQVLCPSKKGDCGTINMNKRLQSAINPPSDEKKELHLGGRIFREGDKIMQIKNNYDIEFERFGENGNGLFNGDMGIIERIDTRNEVMCLKFDDGKAVKYPIAYSNDLELAYAVTVHKSQGSEYDAVIMPIIDVPPRLLYRNLLYTAVTRAKKHLIIIGSGTCLDRMIENNRQNKRYSLLKYMLSEQ